MNKFETSMGEFLNEFLDEYNLTQVKLAKLIKVEHSRINLIINNKRGITVDTDLKLCRQGIAGEKVSAILILF